MMMSMFSSVSGLRSHQIKMDVIGNNIANVNTIGFKGARATFQEIFSQTLSSGGAPDLMTGRGGTNPMQIGLGMNVDAISTDMGRGSVQRTESPTDLSIEGEGFFVVRSGNEGAYTFTRAGNFTIDKAGNLVTSTGKNVYGWMRYVYGDNGYEFDTQEPIRPINLYEDIYNMNKRIIAAKATTEAILSGNLDATRPAIFGTTTSNEPVPVTDEYLADGTASADGDGIPDVDGQNVDPHFIVPINVYDDLGNEYKINLKFWKTYVYYNESEDPDMRMTQWYYLVDPANGATAESSDETIASGYLCFDSQGRIVTTDTNFPISADFVLKPAPETGAGPFTVRLDMRQLSQYADDSSVKPMRVDGYPPGTLVTFSIGDDGVITGVYDNGRQQPLGLIALATFENPAGLEKVGANEFRQTTNSGDFKLPNKPGTSGAGTLVPGTLEMSNVDLAGQFTDMIITQRGFQANSRVLTTSDEILQELANLKR
jgi:flagellar hook protein FlgE